MTDLLNEIAQALRSGNFESAAALAVRWPEESAELRDPEAARMCLFALQQVRELAICQRAHLRRRLQSLDSAVRYGSEGNCTADQWSTEG